MEPVNDPKLKVEWYVNGIEIKAGEIAITKKYYDKVNALSLVFEISINSYFNEIICSLMIFL